MLELKIDFPDALIDLDRKITVTGVPAETAVQITTKTERAGHVWRSQVTVQSDSQGLVDLSTMAPSEGSYTTVNAMGLIHGQQAENAATTDVFSTSVYHPLHTEIEVKVADEVSRTVLTQRLTTESVQRVDITENGLKGVLFLPTSLSVAPAVMLLKRQATGPVDEAHAALYAARGYAAFALDYTELPALDAKADQLGYFAQALDWLRETVSPKHHFVAVSGYEEGAELALLLGTELASEVSAVLACEPTAALKSDYPLAIENIQGPLLLASGKPHSSSAYCKSVADRLQKTGFDYNFQWYDFEGVGAGLRFSHVPTTLTTSTTEQVSVLGLANKALWFAIIGLLHQAVAEAAAPKQLHA